MLERAEILGWLRETDPERLAVLWARADAVRRQHVGDAVHLRGLVEFSNHCVRQCAYCGLRAGNTAVDRYRLDRETVLGCAAEAKALGYGTVVLQSGEDPETNAEWIAGIVRAIKAEHGLAVTLSLGERDPEELALWRAAGADRYLLRFETSNPALFRTIHPPRPGETSDRIGLLRILRDLGYEVGSGVMVGIPGQSWDDLASDLELFYALDLDMIGIGPYIPHPETPLGRRPQQWRLPVDGQVPADERTTCVMIALARLTCPDANIPSTTALATLNPQRGRELGLQRGANVIMPNVTPTDVRAAYEIYPDKACIGDAASACQQCVSWRVQAIGRTIGAGPGPAPNRQRRDTATTA